MKKRPNSTAGSKKLRPRAAKTADILGIRPRKPSQPNSRAAPRRWQKHYARLLQLRTDLTRQSRQLSEEAREESLSYSMHMADCATDSFDRDFALSLLAGEQDALNEIEEAIKRIENGTYGVCEVTGKLIPKARLEAIPWARFTTAAARRLENERALKQTRFAPPETLARAESEEDEEETEE